MLLASRDSTKSLGCWVDFQDWVCGSPASCWASGYSDRERRGNIPQKSRAGSILSTGPRLCPHTAQPFSPSSSSLFYPHCPLPVHSAVPIRIYHPPGGLLNVGTLSCLHPSPRGFSQAHLKVLSPESLSCV